MLYHGHLEYIRLYVTQYSPTTIQLPIQLAPKVTTYIGKHEHDGEFHRMVVGTVPANAGLPAWQPVPYLAKYYFPLFFNALQRIREEILVISGKFFPDLRPCHMNLHVQKSNKHNVVSKIEAFGMLSAYTYDCCRNSCQKQL